MLAKHRTIRPGLWAAVGWKSVGRALASAGLVLLAAACAAPPAKSPNETRPLDEGRARELIANAIATDGATATGPRLVSLPRDKQLLVDIGVSGKRHAIAFITGTERGELGSSVPAHDVGSTALQLVRDTKDRDTRILILHDLAYMTDEQAGEQRAVSSVVVERRLQRDVLDFLAEARRQSWP
jgi:hypothetical protein